MFFSNPYQVIFSIPKRFVDPPPPMSWVTNTHWKLKLYHLDAAYRGHQDNVRFAEEDEEGNDVFWGFCNVFACYIWTQRWKIDHWYTWRYTYRTNPDDFFNGVIFVSWSLHAVPLFPSDHMMELSENNPQHEQQNFTDIFLLLILSVEPPL